MDLNNLKEINDLYGHAAGDNMLITFANELQKSLAAFPSALIFRVGGDESTALVQEHSFDFAAWLQCFRATARQVTADNPALNLAFAVGSVRHFHQSSQDIHALIPQADTLLYKDTTRPDPAKQ